MLKQSFLTNKQKIAMQKNLKLLLLTLMLICGNYAAHAQLGIQLSYFKPGLPVGFVYKSNIGFEVCYNPDNEQDNRYKLGASIGFFCLKPRMDSFPTYSIDDEKFFPAYEVFSRYYFIPFTITNDYKLLDKRFSPILGMDVYFHYSSFSFYRHDVVRTFLSEHRGEEVAGFGLNPKLIFSYDYNETLTFYSGISKSIPLRDAYVRSFWKVFASAQFYF